MDFREVWMNTETIEQPQVESVKMMMDRSRLCQNLTLALILLTFFLLVVNLLTLLYFNRKTISDKIRSKFHRFSHDDCASASYHHVCEEMGNIEAK